MKIKINFTSINSLAVKAYRFLALFGLMFAGGGHLLFQLRL